MHAELVACLQAVQKAVELGIQKIVQALSTECVDQNTTSGLVWELKDSIHCNFVSNVVTHNARSCNLVAHSLVAAGVGLTPHIAAIQGSIPICIQIMVANDLALRVEQWRSSIHLPC